MATQDDSDEEPLDIDARAPPPVPQRFPSHTRSAGVTLTGDVEYLREDGTVSFDDQTPAYNAAQISRGLQSSEFKSEFDEADTNKDGGISFEEFAAVMRDNNPAMEFSEEDLMTMFNDYDEDLSGAIDWAEFIKGHEANMRYIFGIADFDNDERIKYDDMRRFLDVFAGVSDSWEYSWMDAVQRNYDTYARYTSDITEDDVYAMYREIGVSVSTGLNYVEFKRFFKGVPWHQWDVFTMMLKKEVKARVIRLDAPRDDETPTDYIFRKFDVDGDNHMNYFEFVMFLQEMSNMQSYDLGVGTAQMQEEEFQNLCKEHDYDPQKGISAELFKTLVSDFPKAVLGELYSDLLSRAEKMRADEVPKDTNKKAQRIKDILKPADEFLCPITLDIMRDPVMAADGNTYEREAIEKWLRLQNKSPVNNLPMANTNLIVNRNLAKMIGDYRDSLGLGTGTSDDK